MGTQFLYNAGNDANAIIQTARIMPILITILTIILVYFFARRLMGPGGPSCPHSSSAFLPTILAHGHYVTTDVGAAFGILLGSISSGFIETPTTKNLWLAGHRVRHRPAHEIFHAAPRPAFPLCFDRPLDPGYLCPARAARCSMPDGDI